MRNRLILMVCLLMSFAASSYADEKDVRQFTEDHPLVYEDAWDLCPYAFLNNNGEPVGYNVDVLRLIFKELSIPYVIKLKPRKEALADLKEGKADLTLGMDANFNADYARCGKAVVQIFTHSVAHRKTEEPKIQSFSDLAKHKMIVHEGAFSHHLMMQRGWGANAIPYADMEEAVHAVHNQPGLQIVWNTMSLQWLIRKFHYDDLTLTPVNVTHGEYKFMSNNPRLLHQLDSVYTKLYAEGHLQVLQNKWFYPDRQYSGIPSWIWIVVAVVLVLTLVFVVYLLIYRRLERKVTKDVRRSNNRLALILKTSKVHIWIYNVAQKTITTLDEQGSKDGEDISTSFFFYSITEDGYRRILHAFNEIAKQKIEVETIGVHAKAGSDAEDRSLTITLSVLRRDKNGHPTDIIGTTSDVTDEELRQQQVRDTMLRYQSIFNNSMVDIVVYDKDCYITDMNSKVRKALPNQLKTIVHSRISLADVLGMEDVGPENVEYTLLTQLYGQPNETRTLARYLDTKDMRYEMQILPVRDDDGQLTAVYVTGRNVTEIAKLYQRLQRNIVLLQKANAELDGYVRNIDFVLKNGGVRIIKYNLDTHMLIVYSELGKSQLELTQTRAMSFCDDKSKSVALRAFNSMDYRSQSPVSATVKTVLRHHGGEAEADYPMVLYLSLSPVLDQKGRVTGYVGMCRDISELKATEENLAREAAKAQEVETVKNAFLRNMSYQIRTPLNSVVGFAELFELEHSPEDESLFIKEINDNASLLLKLINDILFLSRLDARMIEIKKSPVDFAAIFDSRCQTAWFNYQQPGVKYIADNAYERLVVDIDEQNVGIVIEKILVNAAQHTSSGEVRASYTYTGEDLVMTFQDTGDGIPEEIRQHIFDRFATSDGRRTGLGLSIVQEMLHQMGGKIKIQSEEGKGTIVWVSIPCTCSELVRK